jgi:hypothetical protein
MKLSEFPFLLSHALDTASSDASHRHPTPGLSPRQPSHSRNCSLPAALPHITAGVSLPHITAALSRARRRHFLPHTAAEDFLPDVGEGMEGTCGGSSRVSVSGRAR